MMRVEQSGLEGLFVIEPRTFRDERGFFLENFQSRRYGEVGIRDRFVQDNHSRSVHRVLRGLHFQVKRPQSQIVTVFRGRIFDVAVDLRPQSRTFGKWFGAKLSDAGPRQIYMAPGFAHGFCVLSDFADLHYKVNRYYDRDDEGGVVWNDPDIAIAWPPGAFNVSPRDAAYPKLRLLTQIQLPHDPPAEDRTNNS